MQEKNDSGLFHNFWHLPVEESSSDTLLFQPKHASSLQGRNQREKGLASGPCFSSS